MKNIQRAYNICLPAGRPSSSFVTARLWRVISSSVLVPSCPNAYYDLPQHLAASAINRRPPAAGISYPKRPRPKRDAG